MDYLIWSKSLLGPIFDFHTILRKLVFSKFFDNFIISIVINLFKIYSIGYHKYVYYDARK
jgi:hypothetical protein